MEAEQGSAAGVPHKAQGSDSAGAEDWGSAAAAGSDSAAKVAKVAATAGGTMVS